jgi:CIC family chloride channel protein
MEAGILTRPARGADLRPPLPYRRLAGTVTARLKGDIGAEGFPLVFGSASARQSIRIWIVNLLARAGFKEEYFLILLALLIGTATGFGAHLFFSTMEWVTHRAYNPEHGLYGGRWYMLLLLPAAGATVVGLITQFYAAEAKGHGVPEVMDAIHRKGSNVRPRVAFAKAIASALSIGSGGSAGTEGPIIQIGAAVGSGFGQFFRIHRRQLSTLVACGAAAGIAAIFNAPIAGVLFALEIFLKDFSLRTFSPVVFASVISCTIIHGLSPAGDVAIFPVRRDTHYVFGVAELPYYLVLGLLCAVVAILFIKMLYGTEDLADWLPIPEAFKPTLGALLLGGLGIAFFAVQGSDGTEAPGFFGNGYPLIQSIIAPDKIFEHTMPLLIVLCALKLVATCATLGSGGSGGIFAPSLFMGAATGEAFGLLLYHAGLIDQASISAYALVGMAGVVAGTTHAPLTSIVILYEITREPRVILPVMFATIVATTCAQRLCRDSIYTLKLRRRGVRLGTMADLTILKRITADQVTASPAVYVRPDEPLQKLLELATDNEVGDFVVVDENDQYRGLVVADDIRTALLQPEAVPLLVVGELIRTNVPVVRPTDTLDVVLDAFAHSDVNSLPLSTDADTTHAELLITLQNVMSRYQEELDRPAG